MKIDLLRYADDFLWMMFPSLCAACGKPLFTGEECICTPCRYHLPRTGFHLLDENPVIKHFWGKVKVEHATAYYYFSKGERVQRLIHHLKYKGRKDVGEFIGMLMGKELRNSVFDEVDVVVPVPLHESRLRQRGYNQSDCITEGIAKGLRKQYNFSALDRSEATSTQTRKHRFERYRNVENIFKVTDKNSIAGKNIMLVDDVITTGSTLISCAEALLTIPGTKVFIAALACA
jgi:ComF family protein